jgi:molybdopterin-guanine dinucleotide biosynthesis protein A
MDLSGVTAVLLAGGDRGEALAAQIGVANKAHIPIGGRPMVYYVLSALRQSGVIAQIVHVGACPATLRELVDAVVPSGERMVDSVALGLGAALAQRPSRVLLATADIPWLTPQVVSDFVTQSPEADLVYPIIPAAVAEAQFPNQKRTYARIKEGRFTGGNLVLLRSSFAPRLIPLLDTLYRARKNPLALARLFGLDVIAELLLGRVALSKLEVRAGRILGGTVRAFESRDASLGADIDKLEHLANNAVAQLEGR